MRMNSTTLVIAAAAVLTGCAANPRVDNAEPARPPALRAWIGYPVGRSQVYPIFVNREAYVALFEIVPGRGVSMVYPTRGANAFATDMHYADLALQLGRRFYFSDPFGFANFQPRYYYAIASVAPLNLTRLQASLGATRRILGRMYASYRPYDVIDRLTELVVPMQPDEEWATDLFVDWLTPSSIHGRTVYQRVHCANGRVFWVDRNYPYYGCPGDTPHAVVASSATPVNEIPRDSIREIPRDSLRPRPGDRRQPIQLSGPDAEPRRRAEPGARPPRVGSVGRPPSEHGAIRYGGAAPSTGSAGQPARAPAAEPARTTDNSGRAQPVERGEPRDRQPASERGGSGTERKPQ